MSDVERLHLDERRQSDFERELLARARAWLPGWSGDETPDFARAVLAIAARFGAEVAERLDEVPEKLFRGFFDWLGVRGAAARPAQMPVVFKLAARAVQPSLAPSGTSLQVDVAGANVVFETDGDVNLAPARLVTVIGADADGDRYFVQPPELTEIEPGPALPSEWMVRGDAGAGATKLQLDPGEGLAPGTLLAIGSHYYEVTGENNGLVTISPGLKELVAADQTVARRVTSFSPFDGEWIAKQEHALYLGDAELLNLEAAATIDVVGGESLPVGVEWQYWGRVGDTEPVGWQPLTPEPSPDPATEPEFPGEAVRLTKGKGSLDPHDLGAVKGGRWIRAYTRKVTGKALRRDDFRLRINPVAKLPDPLSSPAADAFANNTPLGLNEKFFPLGREPRLFDTFYLACPEAFSKHGADVTLRFGIADASVTAYSLVPPNSGLSRILAGVGKDGALHLLALTVESGALETLHQREPLQPPAPPFGSTATPSSGPVALEKVTWAPPAWTTASDRFVAVASKGRVWVWCEANDYRKSGWIDFGEVPTDVLDAPIDSLVLLDGGAQLELLALRGGRKSTRTVVATDSWDPANSVRISGLGSGVALKSLVPVRDPATLLWAPADGILAMGSDGVLYRVNPNGSVAQFSAAGAIFDENVVPVATKSVADVVTIAVRLITGGPPELVSHSDTAAEISQALEMDETVESPIEVTLVDGQPMYLASVHGARDSVVSWSPTAPLAQNQQLFRSTVGSVGTLGGGPTVAQDWLVAPGTRGDSLVASLAFADRLSRIPAIELGVVVPEGTSALALNVLVSADDSGAPALVSGPGRTLNGFALYPLGSVTAGAAERIAPAPVIYSANPLAGVLSDDGAGGHELQIPGAGSDVVQEMLLLLDDSLVYRVTGVDLTQTPPVATLAKPNWATAAYPLPPGVPTGVTYRLPAVRTARAASFVQLVLPVGAWDEARVARTLLYFDTGEVTGARVFELDAGGSPILVELVDRGNGLPPLSAGARFVLDGAIGEWQHQLTDTSANPELSWEYWNGSSWATLPRIVDGTLRFKTTGEVTFDVPTDLREGEWAGKNSFWIRARLVGGDYGREGVTSNSRTLGDGSVETTAQRSTSGIRPPLVLSFAVGYRFAEAVLPSYLLTEDSGTLRDQSEANHTDGVEVESFVPLGVTLGRLADGASGRLLMLGFDGPIAGDSVNVLFLAPRGASQRRAAPLTVRALVTDRFTPIAAHDETRALSETGLLTLAFPEAPTPATLFGRELRWILLSPYASGWSPTIRGAYLNAAWASAKETLTRELLGSSEGEPGKIVRLARPPLLHDSLELRVREPLGEEERGELEKEPGRVYRDERGLWVRWDPVVDPADKEPVARVYALDEATGVVRFGDGKHGAIPPVGTDSIVAFTYQRTEPPAPGAVDVPANLVEARTQVNLVSPVEGVESAFSADHSAGGAPPESDERVLRFGAARLRHRDRAVSLRDLEDIALASSPEIAQARALARANRVELVVVMAGDDPAPSESQKRELARLLLAAVPASLAPESLEITAPNLRLLRVGLTLQVESLDHAAAVRQAAEAKLRLWLDTARGSRSELGWPLGASPGRDDIARALLDVPGLLGMGPPDLFEIRGRHERRWPESLQPDELARLAADGLRIEFTFQEHAA